MASLPTGVTIVATSGEDGPAGATANAVSSLSIEPMLMLACLDRGSRTLLAVQAADRFSVSVLHDGQEPVARSFATKAPPAEKWAGRRLERARRPPRDRRRPALGRLRPPGRDRRRRPRDPHRRGHRPGDRDAAPRWSSTAATYRPLAVGTAPAWRGAPGRHRSATPAVWQTASTCCRRGRARRLRSRRSGRAGVGRGAVVGPVGEVRRVRRFDHVAVGRHEGEVDCRGPAGRSRAITQSRAYSRRRRIRPPAAPAP